MARPRWRRGLLLAGALACCIPAAADAQSAAYDRYLNHAELTRAARELVSAHPDIAIRNTRAMPTRIEAAELYSSGVPDRFSISGGNIRVQAGGFTTGELSNEIRLQEKDPETIEVNGGVQGRSSLSVTWIVTGTDNARITYRSQKGGTHIRDVQLR